MQEVINLVASLKSDINAVRLEIFELKKTHAQVLKEEWITKEQVMQILHISDRTFQKIRKKITCSKINGIYLYNTNDLERLIEQHIIQQ